MQENVFGVGVVSKDGIVLCEVEFSGGCNILKVRCCLNW